jgi:hypothetical protein
VNEETHERVVVLLSCCVLFERAEEDPSLIGFRGLLQNGGRGFKS